jgi:methylmalonyl-CoA mutase N-terminal domain/subunit
MKSPIAQALARWLSAIGPSAQRKDKFEFSSLPVEPLYVPDESDQDYLERIAFPGEFPFTRGIHPTMYRGRLWTMRQYAGYASAEESNRRYRYLLEQGQTGLSIAFDLPTQLGFDADNPLAEGEVGKVGVSICSLEDMARLLDGIPLAQVSTSMTINSPAAILLAFYVAVARRQGVEPRRLRGTVQNDILKEYIARGTYIFPPGPAMRLITDVFAYARRELPDWNPISISGYHIREAGATASQEVAFTLANALEYVRAAQQAGLEVDELAPRLAFFFSSDQHFLEEVAKFRAARRMWARLARGRLGAKDPDSWRLRFHTQTAGSTLTAQQPENNVVRVTLQALAAVLGGTQSLHTNSMDEALGLPSQAAVRVALRTQQILAHESGVADSIDPLAGSYLIESLTDEIERQAMTYLDHIQALGGALAALEKGYFHSEIQESAYRAQRRIESGEAVVVGVNRFAEEGSQRIDPLRVDPAVEASQCARLADLRRTREAARVQAARESLLSAAAGTANLMPILIEAAEAQMTLGEICTALRSVWGEYRPARGI